VQASKVAFGSLRQATVHPHSFSAKHSVISWQHASLRQSSHASPVGLHSAVPPVDSPLLLSASVPPSLLLPVSGSGPDDSLVSVLSVVETVVESVVETVVESVVESVVETVVESVVETVVESVVESVVSLLPLSVSLFSSAAGHACGRQQDDAQGQSTTSHGSAPIR